MGVVPLSHLHVLHKIALQLGQQAHDAAGRAVRAALRWAYSVLAAGRQCCTVQAALQGAFDARIARRSCGRLLWR